MTIVIGKGGNCSCYDCIVLYGGKCATTKDNNFLDDLEKSIAKYGYTEKGKKRAVTDAFMDNCISEVVYPKIKKYAKVHRNQFNRHYYSFMPLLFLMTSTHKEAEKMYRRARHTLFSDFIDTVKKASKDKIDYDD